jgi:hypothetical protein
VIYNGHSSETCSREGDASAAEESSFSSHDDDAGPVWYFPDAPCRARICKGSTLQGWK